MTNNIAFIVAPEPLPLPNDPTDPMNWIKIFDPRTYQHLLY